MQSDLETVEAQSLLYRELTEHPKYSDFKLWATENQHVIKLMRDMALERKARGFTKCGLRQLLEAVRWAEEMRIGPDADGYRVNNVFAPLIARLLELANPELRGFFETRTVKRKAPLTRESQD